MKRNLYIALIVATLISVAIGLFAGYAALQHNANNQFCLYSEAGCIADWWYLLTIVLSWVGTTLAIQAAGIFLISGLWKLFIKKNKI